MDHTNPFARLHLDYANGRSRTLLDPCESPEECERRIRAIAEIEASCRREVQASCHALGVAQMELQVQAPVAQDPVSNISFLTLLAITNAWKRFRALEKECARQRLSLEEWLERNPKAVRLRAEAVYYGIILE